MSSAKWRPSCLGLNVLTIDAAMYMAMGHDSWLIQILKSISVSKIRKNIYRSDVQVTFELYGHFRWLQVPNPK